MSNLLQKSDNNPLKLFKCSNTIQKFKCRAKFEEIFAATTIFIFGFNASKLLNVDTVKPGGGETTLRSIRLPPPNRLLSSTLSEHAHYSLCKPAEAKARTDHSFNLTQSRLQNAKDEQD